MTTYLEAIEAKMGDWTYYITKMKFADIVNQVKLADEIHPAPELDDYIQRKISARTEDMKYFLLKNPQRFYGALVVAVYGGSPKFYGVQINEGNQIIDAVRNSFGLLAMDGSQQYFALDGQHRVESIKAACKENMGLLSDEISVIILHHENTEEGLQRTRRLFTKLNRYAKPTNKSEDIAIDEDDAVAIITRRLIRDNPFLKSRVKITGNSLMPKSRGDREYFSTMQTLYDASEYFLKAYDTKIEIDKKFKSNRPKEETLEHMYSYCEAIWNALFDSIPQLRRIQDKEYEAGALRAGNGGGDIWGRPIIHKIIAAVVMKVLLEDRHGLPNLLQRLAKLPSELSSPPWKNTLYSPAKNTVTLPNNDLRELLVEIISIMLDLKIHARNQDQILAEYRDTIEDQEASIPIIPL